MLRHLIIFSLIGTALSSVQTIDLLSIFTKFNNFPCLSNFDKAHTQYICSYNPL